ncbi:mortality factor 4-like protein 1 isoform X2 [Planococcus citri]|uniref:mortality factor 4-like protein 1 isoform X2 n=1 Tax=Planococcus citri TaxID=170843 RepID=UPI0031F860A8
MSSKGGDKNDKKIEKGRFQEGEKILCYHGPLIYEAKCLQVRRGEDGEIEYLIHYSGWNKNWDEWATEDRLLKYSDENVERKKELQKQHKLQQKKSSKRRTSVGSGGEKEDSSSRSNSPKLINSRRSIATPATKSVTTITTPKVVDKQDLNSRKKKDFAHSPELEFHEYIIVNVQIPEDLKNLLLYDNELICRRKKITKVPARVPVDEITEKYVLHKVKVTDSQLASRYKETAYALKQYFNVVVSQKLLYPFEKPQHIKLTETKPDFVPSSVYGVAQFIRLFVKIGHLLAHMQLDDYGSHSVEENINDYVRYLNLNIGKFINIDDYQNTNSDYQRKFKDLYKLKGV